MSKKNLVLLVAAVAIVICGIVLLGRQKKEMTQDEMIERIERITHEVLGEDYKKAAVTKVVGTLTYSNGDEASNIYLHVIQTTYYEAGDPAEITGLHADAFNVLFPVDLMESSEEIMIQDWHGALYKQGDKAYLCWTCNPEDSYVLEYNPEKTEDTDILQMAEGIELKDKQ